MKKTTYIHTYTYTHYMLYTDKKLTSELQALVRTANVMEQPAAQVRRRRIERRDRYPDTREKHHLRMEQIPRYYLAGGTCQD